MERIAYSPIVARPPLVWPGGARVALWVCPNIEHYQYLPGPVRVRDPWPRMPHPDVLGYGIKDYGNRVGMWRLFESMDRLGIKCTVSLNLAAFEHYPEIFEGCEARGWDYFSHGIYNTQYLWDMPEDEEREYVRDNIETFRRLTGRQLAGWFSPAVSHTLNTPDLVAEAGIKYFCDWFHDDQPFPMNVRSGRLITLPYSMELNDAVLHNQPFEAEDMGRMIRDYFDQLHAETERADSGGGRVMCVALHPYWVGQPHRLKPIEDALAYVMDHDGVWQATGEEMADWYYEHCWDDVQTHIAAMEGRADA